MKPIFFSQMVKILSSLTLFRLQLCGVPIKYTTVVQQMAKPPTPATIPH
jgi:hypothetical protein